jgi:hypothetical protein
LTDELLEAAEEYQVLAVSGPGKSGKAMLGQMTLFDSIELNILISGIGP